MRHQITGPSPDAVLYVTTQMRERDRAEIFATRWRESAIDLAEDTLRLKGPVWVGWTDREPVAVWGSWQIWPGVWSVFAYATDRFGEIGYTVTRHIRRAMIPGLLLQGAHRAQCHSLATYTEAHRWLRVLGAKEEARIPKYGRNGEDFLLFGWTLETLNVLRKGTERQQPGA